MTVDPATSCATTPTALSFAVRMIVGNGPPPAIQVDPSADPICEGDSVLFTTTVQNAGSSPTYQWQLNGADVGGSLPTYSNAHLQNGDVVSCRLTNNDVVCTAIPPVSSNPVTITVNPRPVIDLPTIDTIVHADKQVTLSASLTGNLRSYQWTPASDLTNPLSLTPLTTPMASTTSFQLSVISQEGCRAGKTELVRVFSELLMPNSFTPNGDGKNDVFRIPASVALQLKEFDVFDRWGYKVFGTNNIGQGWDGTTNGTRCPPGVYVYIISGSDQKGQVLAKGTVMLLR